MRQHRKRAVWPTAGGESSRFYGFCYSLVPPFAHLTAAIPALSPHEERWLEEETKPATGISNPQRWFRAMNSREVHTL
jgi:hypothetical protein